MKSFAVFSFFALLLASSSSLSLVSSQGIGSENLASSTATPTTTPASTLVGQLNSTPQYYLDLNQPLLPALVNGYFLQPLANLNARISQTAAAIPNQFAQSGQCESFDFSTFPPYSLFSSCSTGPGADDAHSGGGFYG